MIDTKKGKVYNLRQWIENGGKLSDLDDCPNFSVTGIVKGMRKLFYGYECDLVRYNSYYYKRLHCRNI